MNDVVTYEVADKTAVVTINRPEHFNALDEDVIQSLRRCRRRYIDGDHHQGTCCRYDPPVGPQKFLLWCATGC